MSERRRVVQADEPAEKTEALHLKYRPKRLADVRGQDAVVKSLEKTLGGRTQPHCYLFTGPAGTGKTTLARIVADSLGIVHYGIIEVDAASKNGVDDMRSLTEGLRYTGFGPNPNKAIILNECQRLSAGAWDSLLTTTEEPPPHAFFMFTSTVPGKIPKAIVTRCQNYQLKAVPYDDIMDVLEEVCDAEQMDTPGWVLQAVARACQGSVRAALTMLETVKETDDEREVEDLLRHPLEDKEIITICRALVDRKLTWERLVSTLKEMGENAEPESVRIVVCHYLAACLMPNAEGKAPGDKFAQHVLCTLEPFVKPFDQTTGRAALLHAFGRLIFD